MTGEEERHTLEDSVTQEKGLDLPEQKTADENSQEKEGSSLQHVMVEDKIFNPEVKIVYDSDEEVVEDDTKPSNSLESSGSDSGSDSEISSDDEASFEDRKSKIKEDEEFEEDIDLANEGPILSKNELSDETAESLPEGFTIDAGTAINYVGTISGIVDMSVIIKAAVSAEERVLDTGTVFCLENRKPLGYLYEVFGRLQSPVYRIKFNSDLELEPFKTMIGEKVFYILPSAHFLWTKQIKQMKGTDASNANDEELPEEEQEFSDDEQEAAAKKAAKNKRKNKSNTKPTATEKKRKTSNVKQPNMFTSLPTTTTTTTTTTPGNSNQTINKNDNKFNPPSNTTSSQNITQPQPPADINAVAMAQNFFQIFQQANAPFQLESQLKQNANSSSAQPQINQHQHRGELKPSVSSYTGASRPISGTLTPPQQLSHHPQHQHQHQQQPIYYNHYPNAYAYPQQYMHQMQQQQQLPPPFPQQHYNPYYRYQPQQQPQFPMPPYSQQMYQQYPMPRNNYIQQQPVTSIPTPPLSQQQHQQHNPDQTNPALILAQLSGNIAAKADEAANSLQSKNDEYDPSNP